MIENYLDFFAECQSFIFQCCWCFSFSLFAGKSSQIPQFLLEENMTPILCTLPRRFAVVSVAKMVAKARNCQLGEEVGYHIGHSRHLSARYFKHIHLFPSKLCDSSLMTSFFLSLVVFPRSFCKCEVLTYFMKSKFWPETIGEALALTYFIKSKFNLIEFLLFYLKLVDLYVWPGCKDIIIHISLLTCMIHLMRIVL
jgi:hypothetical protein